MIASTSSTRPPRTTAHTSSELERARRWLATGALLAAVAALSWPPLKLLTSVASGTRSWPKSEDLLVYGFGVLAVLCVAASAGLLHVRRLPAQVAVRATSWALLVLGSIGCLVGAERLAGFFGTTTVGAAVALLALGRLHTGSGTFSPRRHRGALLLGLILALADAGMLLCWGGFAGLSLALHGGGESLAAALFFLTSGALMLAAVLGVYRLRVWGVVLNVVTNVGVSALLLTSNPARLPLVLCLPLIATAALQLLLFVPVLRSLTGRSSPGDVWAGWRYLPSAMVLAILAVDVVAVLARPG